LTILTNGHHRHHRNNNLAHTSGVPYTLPGRPHTLHGVSQFAKSKHARECLDNLSRSTDDLWLSNGVGPSISPSVISRSNSEESLDDVSPFSFDFDHHFASQLVRDRIDRNLATVSEDSADRLLSYDHDPSPVGYGSDELALSPNFSASLDWPSTSVTACSPSDLSLSSRPDHLTSPLYYEGIRYQSASVVAVSISSPREHDVYADHLCSTSFLHGSSPWAASVSMPHHNLPKMAQARHHSSSSSNGTTVPLAASPTGSDGATAIVIPVEDIESDRSSWGPSNYDILSRIDDLSNEGWSSYTSFDEYVS
jgi:hypothetical protein